MVEPRFSIHGFDCRQSLGEQRLAARRAGEGIKRPFALHVVENILGRIFDYARMIGRRAPLENRAHPLLDHFPVKVAELGQRVVALHGGALFTIS